MPMELTIHTTIFVPKNKGDPYFIVASTFPAAQDTNRGPGIRRSAFATSIDEAKQQGCDLSRTLMQLIESRGDTIKGINCSGCPAPASPACGRLARIGDA